MCWAPISSIDASGVLTWKIYIIPTPSSVITLYYDYIKNMRFTADGTAANAEFSKIPPVYDKWVYDEFKPLFYEIISPKDRTLIDNAYKNAEKSREFYRLQIMSQADRTYQVASIRDVQDYRYGRVATTSAP